MYLRYSAFSPCQLVNALVQPFRQFVTQGSVGGGGAYNPLLVGGDLGTKVS